MYQFYQDLKTKYVTTWDQPQTLNFSKDERLRIFEPIQVNANLWISIQASYAHYCTPQKTIDDLKSYTHWEMALFNDQDFIPVAEVLPTFICLGEIEDYYNGAVYPYVPTDLINEVYLAFKK